MFRPQVYLQLVKSDILVKLWHPFVVLELIAAVYEVAEVFQTFREVSAKVLLKLLLLNLSFLTEVLLIVHILVHGDNTLCYL